jgi:pyruvate formate lyase activating enzyme
MIIQGFQKVTLLDYPGEVASTLFTYGCNMRCPFCHNPELVTGSMGSETAFGPEEIYAYLEKRKNLLGGVCITGGEPLIHDDLDVMIAKIQELGLKVKLDTNGILHEKLKKLKPDYIAMDIKTSPRKYPDLGFTGKSNAGELAAESASWIIASGIDHEFRTTVVPELVTADDIREIVRLIKGAKRYFLAQFRNTKLLSVEWEKKLPYKKKDLDAMRKIALGAGLECAVRGV